MASVSISCPSCSATDGVVRTAKHSWRSLRATSAPALIHSLNFTKKKTIAYTMVPSI
ncbi:hypothetical protein FOT67_20480 [Citrobacter portucalensis]|nr:hypothetical protein [Citrobacter portucalensis]